MTTRCKISLGLPHRAENHKDTDFYIAECTTADIGGVLRVDDQNTAKKIQKKPKRDLAKNLPSSHI